MNWILQIIRLFIFDFKKWLVTSDIMALNQLADFGDHAKHGCQVPSGKSRVNGLIGWEDSAYSAESLNWQTTKFMCCVYSFSSRWWFRICLFSPLPGEMIQFDKYFSKGGWNHQLDIYISMCMDVFKCVFSLRQTVQKYWLVQPVDFPWMFREIAGSPSLAEKHRFSHTTRRLGLTYRSKLTYIGFWF